MKNFVEIINSKKVRSDTDLNIDGVFTNQEGWNKYKFYPNNGVVGIVIGEAICFEGPICLVWCDDKIIVPVLPQGIRTITESEFRSRLPNNKIVGLASAKQMNSKFGNIDEFLDSIDSWMNR